MIPPGVVAGGSGAAALDPYATVITGLPGGPPLAYWRLAEADAVRDAMPGGRHGTYDGQVSLVSGLAENSDQAILFPGTVIGTIRHDAGLELSEVSLSLWFRLAAIPATPTVILSKDLPGLNPGDFTVWIDQDELIAQFQSASETHRLTTAIEAGLAYHVVVTADGSGFELWLNGKHLGTDTAWGGALADNTQPILLAKAQWTQHIGSLVLDEVALYPRVLADSEIAALSQQAAPPLAGTLALMAPEQQDTMVNVAALSRYMGRKAELTIEITAQGNFGTATVNQDNDIVFTASAVGNDESDAFSYTITDANGTSAPAQIGVTVQAATGGGTLAYRFAPLASWIDGVGLSSRGGSSGVDPMSRWQAGASVGSDLVKGTQNAGGINSSCWNRAPTGHPSLEIYTPPGTGGGTSMINLSVQLWQHLSAASPRHARVVFEVKTCKPSDQTAHKAAGLGPTGGSYPVWGHTHSGANKVQIKYFIGCYLGHRQTGGGKANWWKDHTFPIDRIGIRVQPFGDTKEFSAYSYNFDRPGRFGERGVGTGEKSTDPGVEGVWHRIESEVKLTDPETVPENARRTNPVTSPSRVGNGYVHIYLTKDIDGELGAPGERKRIVQLNNVIFSPKHDLVGSHPNMHQLCTFSGPWINLIYGGSNGSQAEGWAWIRKIEVYRHD
jgi:hypothetical protein